MSKASTVKSKARPRPNSVRFTGSNIVASTTTNKTSKTIPEEEEETTEDEGKPINAKPEWPLEVLYAPEKMTDEGQDEEGQNEITEENFAMDPEGPEYLEYVKTVLKEQGIDFTEWASKMLANAAEGDEGDLTPNQPENTGHDSLEAQGTELNDSSEEASSGEGTGSSSSDYSESRSSEDIDDPLDGFVQDNEPTKPLMGMKSFRYFEARVLANFLKENEDERLNSIRERFNHIKKVKAPVVSSGLTPSIKFLKFPPAFDEYGALDNEEDEDGEEEDEDEEETEEGMMEFSDKQWALKNAEMFLKTAGCRSPEESVSNLKVKQEDQSPKLKVFLAEGGIGEKHRYGIGDKEGAKEINSALKRMAERAMWRAIIDNSKPKYPLPRFILPRHKFLRKVESELIGPGSYEHDYWDKQRQKRMARMPSLFQSCSSRFPKEKWRAPGADFIADPFEKWDAACLKYKHPGRGVPFESTPCNFRYRDFYIGCGIPPNAYNIKSPLEEFLNKNKGNKGAYDIPAGADVFCPKSKQSDPASRLGPGAYDVRESIVKNLTDSYNNFKGKISKTERRKMFSFKAAFETPLWPADNGYPGPDAYKPFENEEWIEPSWAPFGVQGAARKLDLNIQAKMMAPDYYYYGDGTTLEKGWKPEIHGGGLTSNFLSKSPQNTPDNKHNVIKERNQSLNLHLDQDLMNQPKRNDNEC